MSPVNFKVLLASVVTVLSSALPVSGQCAANPSDTAFGSPIQQENYATVYPSAGAIQWGAELFAPLKLGIDRVAGPGTAAEFDNDGFLINWQQYVDNGVLSPTAWLSIRSIQPTDDIGGAPPNPVVVKAYINGRPDPVYTRLPPAAQFGAYEHCIEISTRWLRFAKRVPNGKPNCDPAQGDTSACGMNEIAFVVAVDPHLLTVAYIGVGTLSLKAMAPIVLVHGWNAGPWVWGPTPANGNLCPPNPQSASDGGQNFVQALINAKVPFDCSVRIRPQALIAEGAQQLADQLLPILNSFGTRHVNLIAHSKGGLFARGFLQTNALADGLVQIGVISLTTLDTPHHGSVLADTVANFTASELGAVLRFLGPGFLGRGADDMTIDAVRAFNDDHLQPPPQFRLRDSSGNSFFTTPFYYSTSADADINGNGVIGGAEAAPYSALSGRVAYQIVARGRPVTLTQLLGLLFASVSSLPDYERNDLLVPIRSARYLRFSEINSYVGVNGRNHQTIRTPDVAQLALQNIRVAESRQPEQ